MRLLPIRIKDTDLLEIVTALKTAQGERNGLTKGTDPVIRNEGKSEVGIPKFHHDRVVKNREIDINNDLITKLQAAIVGLRGKITQKQNELKTIKEQS
tara:strand:- start:889 stop:1182 length:294 start_codon:yes stop_codon:yes gene_type:complete